VLTTSFWPKDERAPLVDFTVGGLLAERASTQPDAPALVGTEHGTGSVVRLTYRELYERAQRVASALAALTEPGEPVAVWAPNVVEWPVLQYGAALSGVVLVAINPALRGAELTYALTHSKAVVLVHADRSRDYDMAGVAAEVRRDCPALRTVISLSEADRWQAAGIDPSLDVRSPTDPDAAVMLQYTSGTTGNPKGVLLRHRSLVNVAKLTLEAVGVPHGATAVNPLPMFHTAGCVISTLGPLWVAGTAVLVEQFEPVSVLATLRDEQADVLFYVPTILGAVLAAQAASNEPAPQLHTILGGASVVPPAMVEAAERTFGASVINVFGQTELAPVLTATRPGDPHREHLHTVGRPLPHVDCAILNPATGAVQPLGVPGEICARGYQQLICYLDDPQATAATVDADGFVHTGDLGSMDAAGYITLTGRLKELIIRGGENVSPVEIEACLLSHPEVADAAVVGIADERLGERVVAIVTPVGDAAPGIAERLTAHCRSHLAPHKTPSDWYRLDALPRTPTGKVQKFRLADLLDRDECPDLP
jgi:fatty-acyl-CoA synthase/long-chain acyl-CoA synthetase